MNNLEKRYRKALRFYPVSWRLSNEEAIIGTLLDKAEAEGRTRPLAHELLNLAANGILLRSRLIPSVVPQVVRDRASTAALSIGAAIALTATMQLESSPNRFSELFGHDYPTFGPFASPAIIIYAVWAATFFAAIAGFTTAARGMAFATIPLSFAIRALADASGMVLRPTWSFLGLLALLACLVVFGRPASNRASIRWLVAWFLPAAIIFTLPQALINRGGFAFQEPLWLDRPDVIPWSPIIAIAFALVFQLAGKTAWAAAALLVGIPFTAVAVLGARGVPSQVAWLAFVAAATAVAIVLVLRFFGLRIQFVRVRTPYYRPRRRSN